MSGKLILLGATGKQGGAVLDFVLNDPELSARYDVVAVTRDVKSEKARQLAASPKVTVVQANTDDQASLETTFIGASAVYAVTTRAFGPDGLEKEFSTAKRIADAAVAAKVDILIFSTLPYVSKISGGKYARVSHFDSKARAEGYIRTLPIKSAFVSLGIYMQNYIDHPFFAPTKIGPDTWALIKPIVSSTPVPIFDVTDTGKLVGAILANPDGFEGKTFYGATAKPYSLEEQAALLSRSSGKKVIVKEVSDEDFRMPYPPEIGSAMSEVLLYTEEFKYWGPKSDADVAWSTANARGQLKTFEQFLEKHPLRLA